MTEKADKFKRLAIKRTKNALKQIELIGNLAGPNYKYTQGQVNKIISVLQKALEGLEQKFVNPLEEEFDLEDEAQDEITEDILPENVTPKKKQVHERTKLVKESPEDEEEDEDLDEDDLDDDLDIE